MRLNRLMPLITLVLITGCANTQLTPAGKLQGPVPVLRVVDGDTVEPLFGEIEESFRLVGIDTPEVYPEAEPDSPEASAYTEKLLFSREVFVEIALEERDRHDRVLVYLYVEDSEGSWQYGGMRLEQVNHEMARAGYADVLTIAPNVQYSGLYQRAVQEARTAGRGMWAN